jgi:hypothetical protein
MSFESDSDSQLTPGIKGFNSSGGDGVEGISNLGPGSGVFGNSDRATGVFGHSNTGFAIRGESAAGEGFIAGIDPVFHNHAGVFGRSDQQGVIGVATGTGTGVRGASAAGEGFIGGIDPVFHNHAGVFGRSDQQGVIGVATGTGTGVFGTGGKFAGRFEGDVQVTGSVEITGNLNLSSPTSDLVLGDVAEGFTTQDSEIIEPGTVVVLDQHGLVRPGDEAYDKKVVGVVSGAGDYRSAIVLDNQQLSRPSRLPIALMGKVYCKVDARYSPIEVGDLLTTSPTSGHAMKATDSLRGFGSVLGKALLPLNKGQGMIPILIALQ